MKRKQHVTGNSNIFIQTRRKHNCPIDSAPIGYWFWCLRGLASSRSTAWPSSSRNGARGVIPCANRFRTSDLQFCPSKVRGCFTSVIGARYLSASSFAHLRACCRSRPCPRLTSTAVPRPQKGFQAQLKHDFEAQMPSSSTRG